MRAPLRAILLLSLLAGAAVVTGCGALVGISEVTLADAGVPYDGSSSGGPTSDGASPPGQPEGGDSGGAPADASVSADADANGPGLDAGGKDGAAPDANLFDAGCSGGAVACMNACCAAGQVCTGGSCSIPVTSTAAGTLRLWLTADFGLHCTGGTATGWSDRSPSGNDATTTSSVAGPDGGPVGSHLGPSCNVAGHTLNGIPVPYFSAPNGGPPYVDSSFDIDLAFLANNPQFTIFVVERRWAPEKAVGMDALFLGTETPGPDTVSTSNTPAQSTLQIGYVSYNSGAAGYCQQLSIDFGSHGAQNAMPAVMSGSASALSIDTFQNSSSAGMRVWNNGYLLPGTNSYDIFSSIYASQLAKGSIGRALRVNTQDERFNGDIAELIVFNAALSEADRMSVEGYLEAHWGAVMQLTNGGACP